MPLAAGGWRGVFPDFPACEANGPNLDLAVSHATSVLTQQAEDVNGGGTHELRAPRDLTAVRNDRAWASDNAIDWATAVVTMIRMPQ